MTCETKGEREKHAWRAIPGEGRRVWDHEQVRIQDRGYLAKHTEWGTEGVARSKKKVQHFIRKILLAG